MRPRGFTLLELLVVVAIIALASAAVSLSLRDSTGADLEREGQRLVALLEAARAQSRMQGTPVRWTLQPNGFAFDGLAPGTLPTNWLGADVVVLQGSPATLGPEPVIGPQTIALSSRSHPERHVWLRSDGVRPFALHNDDGASAAAPP